MSYTQVDDESFKQQFIEDVIGDLISGVTGLDRNKVRPAHQSVHPVLKQNETICVFNIHRSVRKGFWGNVNNELSADRSELHIHIFFYGLDGFNYINKLIRGVFIPNNTYELAQHSMAVMSFTDIYEIPVNINGIELTRHDVTMKVSIARNIKYTGNTFNGISGINIFTEKEIIHIDGGK